MLYLLMRAKSCKINKSHKFSIEVALFEFFSNHFHSYDKNKRPKKNCVLPLFSSNDMLNEHTNHDFYCMHGFSPDQFEEIIENVILILEKIVCPQGHYYDKEIAFFLCSDTGTNQMLGTMRD